MQTAYLALGSNLGDRRRTVSAALAALARDPRNANLRVSAVYETAPVGPPGQSDYLNLAAALETAHDALSLLDACLAIEQSLGRVRRERWGPRTLDLDLLLLGDLRLQTDRLTLPHPRLTGRAFVLAPLADLAPGLVVDGDTVRAHLARVGLAGVRRLPDPIAW